MLVRHKADLLEKDPPFSTHSVLERCFPDIRVAGADLPRGVIEMADASQSHRVLLYNRKVNHAAQRVGLMHGLHHHMTDLKNVGDVSEIRECNLPLRQLALQRPALADPIEVACDVFAAEILTPFDVIDEYVPDDMTGRDLIDAESRYSDELDRLASRFNVPRGFIKWRLYDLIHLRKTHFFTGR